MDWDLVEAARDLGASPLKAFLTVTLKLTLPGLLSGVILTFIPSMGLFFIADILGGNKIVLVGSVIQEQITKGVTSLCGGTVSCIDGTDFRDDPPVPQDHRNLTAGRDDVAYEKEKMALCICSADHSADLYPDPVDGGVFLQCLQADFRVGGLFPEMVPGVVPGQRSGGSTD